MQFLTGLLLGALITGYMCGCLQFSKPEKEYIPPNNQYYKNYYVPGPKQQRKLQKCDPVGVENF